MRIDQIKKKLQGSSGLKNVFRISSGTLIGQAVSFITLPVFTRLYGAEVIGVWAILNTIATVVNSFSDAGLIRSIMMEDTEEGMLQVYRVISTIGLGVSILSGLAIFGYYTLFPSDDMIVSPWFLGVFILVAVFTLQQTQVCYSWLNRMSEYKVLMKNPIINNASFGVVGILLGVLGFKEYGYFIGWMIGQLLTLVHMKRFLPKKMFLFRIKTYKAVFKEKKRFVLYQMPTNMITVFKDQLPVMLIRAFFGTTILGYYFITVRVLQIPITLLANAMGRVFYQTTTDMKRRGEQLGAFVYKTLTSVMKVAAVPIILLMSVGDVVLTFFLGEQWLEAGSMLRILALQCFFMFLMTTMQGITITIEKQQYSMLSSVALSCAIALSLTAGKFLFNNLNVGLVLLVVTFVIINILYFCAILKVLHVSRKKYLTHVFAYMGIILAGSELIRAILYFFHLVPGL